MSTHPSSTSPPLKLIAAFHKAINYEKEDEIKELLLSCPSLIHSIHEGLFPLQRAAYMGSPSLLTFLLDNGAEVDGVGEEGMKETGESALVIAAEGGDVEGCLVLLERGADPCFLCRITPLHGGVRSGVVEVVRLLLDFGGDPELCSGEKVWGGAKTPGEVARALKFRETEELLEGWGGMGIKG